MEIDILSHLTSLDLSGNQLETLPPHVSKLTNLLALDLSDNRLWSLPHQLGTLTSLLLLKLEKNPRLVEAPSINEPLRVSLRPELVANGDAHKLLPLLQEPPTPFSSSRMRLMFVGQVNNTKQLANKYEIILSGKCRENVIGVVIT